MEKTKTIEYWCLRFFDEEMNQISTRSVINEIMKKPANDKLQDSRFCNNGTCSALIDEPNHDKECVEIRFKKFEKDDIEISYFEDGDITENGTEIIKKHKEREDIANTNYSYVRIYDNGIVLFLINKKALSPQKLRDYLQHHIKTENKHNNIEFMPVYRKDFYEMLLKEDNITEVSIDIGFNPIGSLDDEVFKPETKTGAVKAKVILFARDKKRNIKSSYLRKGSIAEFFRNMTFPFLNTNGQIFNGQLKYKEQESKKIIPIKLDSYQLKHTFNIKTTSELAIRISTEFDHAYKINKDFLFKYLKVNEQGLN